MGGNHHFRVQHLAVFKSGCDLEIRPAQSAADGVGHGVLILVCDHLLVRLYCQNRLRVAYLRPCEQNSLLLE